jgi:hypothetical protein
LNFEIRVGKGDVNARVKCPIDAFNTVSSKEDGAFIILEVLKEY